MIIKKWIRTSLLITVMLGVLMFLVFKLFHLTVAKTSSKDIEFAPAPNSQNVFPANISKKPKNIIVFIADGLGFSHMSLSLLSQKSEEPSVWHQFDVKGWHDPRSHSGSLTDSGASATALATGFSTHGGMIGQDSDGNEVKSIFELASENRYNTGIVTDSYIWDATPAAFVAHTESRDNAEDILKQYASSDLDLLFGELEDLGQGDVPDKASTINILEQRFELLAQSQVFPEQDSDSKPIAAIFGEDEIQDLNSSPNLPRLTELALQYFVARDQPFVLMVECEEMDSASHRNDSKRVMKGLKSIEQTLSNILSFSKSNKETLVLFTSDHETGGLATVSYARNYPDMQLVWATRDHTATVVPILAQGPGSLYFSHVERNWQIGELLKLLVSSE